MGNTEIDQFTPHAYCIGGQGKFPVALRGNTGLCNIICSKMMPQKAFEGMLEGEEKLFVWKNIFNHFIHVLQRV